MPPKVWKNDLDIAFRPFCFFGDTEKRPGWGPGLLFEETPAFSGLGGTGWRLWNSWCSVVCFFAGLATVGTFNFGIAAS
jgi:hypothetical protein